MRARNARAANRPAVERANTVRGHQIILLWNWPAFIMTGKFRPA